MRKKRLGQSLEHEYKTDMPQPPWRGDLRYSEGEVWSPENQKVVMLRCVGCVAVITVNISWGNGRKQCAEANNTWVSFLSEPGMSGDSEGWDGGQGQKALGRSRLGDRFEGSKWAWIF